MASKKMTLFLSDRLQRALGPVGGFADPGSGALADPKGDEVTGLGLTRRANMLGDRYQALIDHADIQSVLSLPHLLRLAELIGPVWDGPGFKIDDLAHVVAVKLGGHGDDAQSLAGLDFADLQLIESVAGLSFVQKVAAVEWVERHCFAAKSGNPANPAASSGVLAANPASTPPLAASLAAITPKKLLKAALMGIKPGPKACADALKQLDAKGFTKDRSPKCHDVIASMASGALANHDDIDSALKEIGGQ